MVILHNEIATPKGTRHVYVSDIDIQLDIYHQTGEKPPDNATYVIDYVRYLPFKVVAGKKIFSEPSYSPPERIAEGLQIDIIYTIQKYKSYYTVTIKETI